MYWRGGYAYVYLCYGVHHLFNVVTAAEGIPHAVLVRGIQPLEGLEIMQERRGKEKVDRSLTSGPGSLSRAMGIHTGWTGMDMLAGSAPVWIEDRAFRIPPDRIANGPRVGIDYAGEYRSMDWRYWVKGSRWVSTDR
jgi:DNA-3-methyladenine glycosylase